MRNAILYTLAAIGTMTLVAALSLALLVMWIVAPFRSHPRTEAIQVSPVASQVAGKLSPLLQNLAEANKDELVRSSGGVVAQLAVRKIWPTAVKAIPRATAIGCDKALDYLDTLKMSDVAAMLLKHAKAKGHN